MKIEDITEDCVISIAVVRGNTSVNLQTEPAFATSDGIMVHPFMHEDTIINFNVPDLRIEMIVVHGDEVPQFWKSVTITREIYQGEVYHCIHSKVEGVRLNRRTSFRVFIGETGVVGKIPGGKEFSVTVKDISAVGVGFITRGLDAPEFARGDAVHISFEDKEFRFSIDIMGRIVRMEKDDTKTVYGCTFSKAYPQVDRYCAQKQVRKGVNKKAAALLKK